MRTTMEIIDAAKDNEPVTEDEFRYALCAMDALSTFDHSALARLIKLPHMAKFEHGEMFRRWKMVLGKSPKDYLGANFDPKNPEYQKMRKLGQKILNKVMGEGK